MAERLNGRGSERGKTGQRAPTERSGGRTDKSLSQVCKQIVLILLLWAPTPAHLWLTNWKDTIVLKVEGYGGWGGRGGGGSSQADKAPAGAARQVGEGGRGFAELVQRLALNN